MRKSRKRDRFTILHSSVDALRPARQKRRHDRTVRNIELFVVPTRAHAIGLLSFAVWRATTSILPARSLLEGGLGLVLALGASWFVTGSVDPVANVADALKQIGHAKSGNPGP